MRDAVQMGTTYDIVPCLNGESPHASVARCYGEDDINEILVDHGLEPVRVVEHPAEDFAAWRAHVLDQVLSVDGWDREDDDDGTVVLWSDRWGWQIEVNANVTLRWRKDPRDYELSDYEMLLLFNERPSVLIFPSIWEWGWIPVWDIEEPFNL